MSNFLYGPSVVLNRFHRKYESGGLGLTAGDFSQLSRPEVSALDYYLVDDDAQLH